MGSKLWKAQNVGEYADVKASTVYGWVHKQIGIPYIKIKGTRTIRFDPEAVQRWIRSQEVDRRKRNFED